MSNLDKMDNLVSFEIKAIDSKGRIRKIVQPMNKDLVFNITIENVNKLKKDSEVKDCEYSLTPIMSKGSYSNA